MREELYLMLRRLGFLKFVRPDLTELSFIDDSDSILTTPLFFCNQSIRIDERHVPGYVVKVSPVFYITRSVFGQNVNGIF